MTVIRLEKFADGSGWLRDVGDAEFVHERKLKDHTVLDFSGVVGVSGAFLDTLLKGQTPESVGGRVDGMNVAVDAALASWIDRSSAPVKPIETAKKPRRVRVTKPKPKPSTPAVEREPVTDDRFTPTRLVQRLGDSLRGYIESAYPLSDPTLIRARRHLLETEAGGHLLSQEPFIETTTRYASSPLG